MARTVQTSRALSRWGMQMPLLIPCQLKNSPPSYTSARQTAGLAQYQVASKWQPVSPVLPKNLLLQGSIHLLRQQAGCRRQGSRLCRIQILLWRGRARLWIHQDHGEMEMCLVFTHLLLPFRLGTRCRSGRSLFSAPGSDPTCR